MGAEGAAVQTRLGPPGGGSLRLLPSVIARLQAVADPSPLWREASGGGTPFVIKADEEAKRPAFRVAKG